MSDIRSDSSDPMTRSLQAIVERLTDRYHGVFSKETVAGAVWDSWDRLIAQATLIPPFMPTLVERFAKDQLRAAAQVEGLIPKKLPEVLFVCVHNAGRSQIAAALAHHLGQDRIRVRSAGSSPRGESHAPVVEAMREIGLDLTQEFPKPLTDIVVRAADFVITMGCGDACPIFPGKHYEDWDVADPAGQPLEVVREIRADIEQHVKQLLESLPTQAADQVGSRS